MKKCYEIRDREAGNVVDSFFDREESEMYLKRYEDDDKADGSYTENFYEIVDIGKDFVVTYEKYGMRKEVEIHAFHKDDAEESFNGIDDAEMGGMNFDEYGISIIEV